MKPIKQVPMTQNDKQACQLMDGEHWMVEFSQQ